MPTLRTLLMAVAAGALVALAFGSAGSPLPGPQG
jgi:hypothetical protein